MTPLTARLTKIVKLAKPVAKWQAVPVAYREYSSRTVQARNKFERACSPCFIAAMAKVVLSIGPDRGETIDALRALEAIAEEEAK